MKIYHYPRCANSRAGLKYLEGKGYTVEIRQYITEGISEEELREVIGKTGKKPVEFVRIQEKQYKEKYQGQKYSDDEWIKIFAENPRLLQRPIVVINETAVLANPPEAVEQIM